MTSMKFNAWVAAASLALLSAACNNTADGMKRDAEENKRAAAQASDEARERADRAADRAADSADRAGDRAANAAERTGDKIAEGARDTRDAVGTAGEKVGDAASHAGRATDAAIQTMDVKTALMADKRVDASDINVDTDGPSKTVTLKGHVPNTSQKTIAARIAEEKAPGYKIKNELMVK